MKDKKKILIGLAIISLFVIGICIYLIYDASKKIKEETPKENVKEVENKVLASPYRMNGNSLEDFDLYFLGLENEKKNKIYSPLSIKYALAMLNEGAVGETKNQITSVIGDYKSKKYENSQNMSLANALFIKDSYKDNIKETYVNTLKEKYNADVVYDSFANANTLNSWVKNKTLNLIDNLFDDVSDNDYILTNALAIDMEWKKKIQPKTMDDGLFSVDYQHENYHKGVGILDASGYKALDFKDVSHKTQAVEILATANKYDIISTLGEENIRKTVKQEYQKWLSELEEYHAKNPVDSIYDTCINDEHFKFNMDNYINELKSNYKQIDSSTDFKFYDDQNVKVFAKELKEYNGTTLEYIGTMPKNQNLDEYIKNIKAANINVLINKLKNIELNSFKDGVITEIKGFIPMFKFDYELKLKEDLNKLGITNVFDENKSQLTNLTTNKAYIGDATHKANIEFSNEGIKASAATGMFGFGDGPGCFNYEFEVPVETIDLTFDSPYLFIIRDKDSGEVWFTGTVYEPIEGKGSVNKEGYYQ